VNELLRNFGESQRMMRAVAEGRSPIPGLALPGGKMTAKAMAPRPKTARLKARPKKKR
jgi:hypothetical protein